MELTDEQRKAYLMELDNNPVLKEFLAQQKQNAVNLWLGSSPLDVDAKEDAWRDHKAAERFEAAISEALTKLTEEE